MSTRASAGCMKLKLGFDNYALRSLGWKASQLLDHAAALHLDALLISDLDAFERRDDASLRDFGRCARDCGIELHVGTLSICPSSVIFDKRRGTAEQQLRETIRVARAVGSPVARCVLGKVEDRRSPGGIEARIAETVEVLRRVRGAALDGGIKVAVENHAGDMQAHELVALIHEAGPDFVGATLDTGNATWALEHPQRTLETLGPYTLTTGIRDSALWEAPDGATLQWTAMGEGAVDWKKFFARYAELCPDVPVMLEIISGRPIPIPFLREDFWDAYPKQRPREFAEFLSLIRGGKARKPFASHGSRRAEQRFQIVELERSVRYCKEVLALGRH
ncbi:MAG: sugar phosphate isomerase/epimerase [Verrucomicrobia bacterium]|nr:sugar phosphate isomerase/epimerase [Verrucomicrobiota bacterium]